MAHNTGWSKFAENFNSVYNVTSGAFQKYDINKIMKEKPQVISKGLAEGPRNQYVTPYEATFLGNTYDKELTDDQKRGLRNAKIADVYTKYGNTDKAAEMLAAASQLEKDQAAIASSIASTALSEQTLKQNQGLYQGKINAQDANLRAMDAQTVYNTTQSDLAQMKLDQNDELNKILMTASAQDFGSGAERVAWFREAIQFSNNPAAVDYLKTMTDNDVENAFAEAAALITKITAAQKLGRVAGIPKIKSIIDAQDGITGNIVLENTKEGIVLWQTDKDGKEIPGSRISGSDWTEFNNNLSAYLDPVTAFQAAVTAEAAHQAIVRKAVNTFKGTDEYKLFQGTSAELSDMVANNLYDLFRGKLNVDGTLRYPKPTSAMNAEELAAYSAEIEKIADKNDNDNKGLSNNTSAIVSNAQLELVNAKNKVPDGSLEQNAANTQKVNEAEKKVAKLEGNLPNRLNQVHAILRHWQIISFANKCH